MALPKDVSKAVVRLDYTALPITEENNLAAWQTIRAELTRLTEIADAVDPLVVRLGEVTTRLEAADELLREAEGELRCACQSRKAARISQDIRVYLLSQDAELKILRVKCSGTLANNLCPDHRDKQVGNPCLACTIEKLQSRLADERIQAHLSENTHDRA
jgi:hypothetical protein